MAATPLPARHAGRRGVRSIEGDSKSYSFKYVDWEHPENNVYHVTAEMAVERTASTQTRRCDIVCFVNGIPFIVIDREQATDRAAEEGRQPAHQVSE